MLTTARQGVWCLEQPGSSVLEYYPAWLHFLAALYQFYGMEKAPILVHDNFDFQRRLIN